MRLNILLSVFSVVTCGPPPIPDNARIVYDIWRAPGGKAKFGVRGTYKCVPPMALIGNPRAECTSSGTWTVAPMCQSKTIMLQWYTIVPSSAAIFIRT